MYKHNEVTMLPPILWEIIKQALILLSGYVFLLITGKYADFPLTQELFTKLMLWIVATVLGVKAAAMVVYHSVKGTLPKIFRAK